MWIGQRSLQTHRLKTQNERSCRQEHSQDLKPDMKPECGARVTVVEASHEDGSRHNEEERDSRQDRMSCDICFVIDHVPESIAHACMVSMYAR